MASNLYCHKHDEWFSSGMAMPPDLLVLKVAVCFPITDLSQEIEKYIPRIPTHQKSRCVGNPEAGIPVVVLYACPLFGNRAAALCRENFQLYFVTMFFDIIFNS